MGKVTTPVVTLLIVCPLWINYTSKSARTNFASTFFPSSKMCPLATDLIEEHTWAIGSITVELLFHPQLFPVRMTIISGNM